MKVTITKADGQTYLMYCVQERSNGFTLAANTEYTISFYAKSDNNNEIQAALQLNISPNTTYALNTYTLTANYALYSFTYTPTIETTNVWLVFNCAKQLGNIWIDLVSVSDGTTNKISNSSFETGLTSWNHRVSTIGDTLAEYLPIVSSDTNISGAIIWHLFPHGQVHGYDSIGADHYKLHYPGTTADYTTRIQSLRTHNYTIRGISPVPSHIVPQVPIVNSMAIVGNSATLDWRGAACAATYNLQQSFDGGTWETVSTGLVDTTVPSTVTISPGNGPFYRLLSVSLGGVVSTVIPKTHDVTLQQFIKGFELGD